jgi:hypothetical protein
LIQLIAEVLILHRPTEVAASKLTGSSQAQRAEKQQMPAAQQPSVRRLRLPVTASLDRLLIDSLRDPSSSEELSRWLLLLGTVIERQPGACSATTRDELLPLLVAQLPSLEPPPIGGWGTALLATWCLGQVAAHEDVGAARPIWGHAWTSLQELVSCCVARQPNLPQACGSSGPSRELAGFMDLAACCMSTLLDRQLLQNECLASAIAMAQDSALFDPAPKRETRTHTSGIVDRQADSLQWSPAFHEGQGGGTYLCATVQLARSLCSAAARDPSTQYGANSGLRR